MLFSDVIENVNIISISLKWCILYYLRVSCWIVVIRIRVYRKFHWSEYHWHGYNTKKSTMIYHSSSIYLFNKWQPRHDDVIKWKHFPRNWPFVRGIHRSPVNSPHKGQWRGALMFSLICILINDWVNNREAGDLRRQRTDYDVSVMTYMSLCGFNRP